jgi:hypothetical protein
VNGGQDRPDQQQKQVNFHGLLRCGPQPRDYMNFSLQDVFQLYLFKLNKSDPGIAMIMNEAKA